MIRVGGEVDAFCTRCQLVLGHTVIAVVAGRPVKVECNTCHSVHAHRGGAARAPRRTAGKPAGPGFDELLAARGGAGARRYSPRDTFREGEVLDHPQFGRGLVSSVRDGGKVEVTFRGGPKTLVHGRRER